MKSSIAKCFPEISEATIEAMISLTRKRQYRIGTEPDLAVYPASKMHAEKGEAWIRYWVDESAHHRSPFRTKHIIVASERDDLWGTRHTSHACQPVGVQACTTNDIVSLDEIVRRFQAVAAVVLVDGTHFVISTNLSSTHDDFTCVSPGDLREINDARGGGVERLDPCGIRLDFAQAFW